MTKAAEVNIAPAPDMIGGKPPEKVNQVRSRNSGNPVPSHTRKIEVFHSLTVNMDFILPREPRDPFSNAPLGSMPLIDERRNNRNASCGHDPDDSLRANFHYFAPTRKNEQAPDARPADRTF